MEDNPTPVQFLFSNETPIVDENGTPIPLDLVRVNLPLTVQYLMQGDNKMAAQRVVISRSMIAGDADEKPENKRMKLAEETRRQEIRAAAEELARPKEIAGSLSAIEQTVSLVPRGETAPIMCVVNNSTRFVNSVGQPMGTHMLSAGMPITVVTVRDGKRLVAQEIKFHGGLPTTGDKSAIQAANENGVNPDNNPAGGTNGSANSSDNADGLSELQVQDYILPGQLPGQFVPKSAPIRGNGTIPNQESSLNRPTPPNSKTNRHQNSNPDKNPANKPNQNQPKIQQPNAPQPGATQPNVSPPGSNQKTSKLNGSGGDNNGSAQSGQKGTDQKSATGGTPPESDGGVAPIQRK